ncbi:MAG: hypothetical protein DRQ62_09680, partial [Gammaproteobacteria bacterium]
MPQKKSSWNHWKLLTRNGRQVWAFKADSHDIDDHLKKTDSFSEQELRAFSKDFAFDRKLNPTSADQVFRQQAIENNDSLYSGKIPEANTTEEQTLIDSLIKGIHYFSQLQSEEGHWPGDYGGPLFLLPGLLIASYISDTP